MMHNQMLPNHKEEWFKFFQMVQQQLQEPSVDERGFSTNGSCNHDFSEYIDGVIARVRTLSAKEALESAGIETEDLLSLLRETKEYLLYSESSLNCYLKPLERYCQLKEKSSGMSGSSQPPHEDQTLQEIRRKISNVLQTGQGAHTLSTWATEFRPRLGNNSDVYIKMLENDRDELLAEYPQQDAREIISEHYKHVIRGLQIPDQ